jgi:hypothetical protein
MSGVAWERHFKLNFRKHILLSGRHFIHVVWRTPGLESI